MVHGKERKGSEWALELGFESNKYHVDMMLGGIARKGLIGECYCTVAGRCERMNFNYDIAEMGLEKLRAV